MLLTVGWGLVGAPTSCALLGDVGARGGTSDAGGGSSYGRFILSRPLGTPMDLIGVWMWPLCDALGASADTGKRQLGSGIVELSHSVPGWSMI